MTRVEAHAARPMSSIGKVIVGRAEVNRSEIGRAVCCSVVADLLNGEPGILVQHQGRDRRDVRRRGRGAEEVRVLVQPGCVEPS